MYNQNTQIVNNYELINGKLSFVKQEPTTNWVQSPGFELHAAGARFLAGTVGAGGRSTDFSTSGAYGLKQPTTVINFPGQAVIQAPMIEYPFACVGEQLASAQATQDTFTWSFDVKGQPGDDYKARVQEVWLFDDFNRTNSTNSIGAPNNAAGVNVGGLWLGSGGLNIGINNFEMYDSDSSVHQTYPFVERHIALGSNNISVEADFKGRYAYNAGGMYSRFGLVFRYVDAANFLYLVLDNSTNNFTQLILYMVKAGVRTPIGSFSVQNANLANDTYYAVGAICNGNVITYYTDIPNAIQYQQNYTLSGGDIAIFNGAGAFYAGFVALQGDSAQIIQARSRAFKVAPLSVTGAVAERPFTLEYPTERQYVTFTAELQKVYALQLIKLTNNGKTFYSDSYQVERKAYPTTYIDGNRSEGRWLGDPNNSASERLAGQPGGRSYTFEELGLKCYGIAGGGMSKVNYTTQEYAERSSRQITRASQEPKVVILDVEIEAAGLFELNQKKAALENFLAYDELTGLPTPLLLQYQIYNGAQAAAAINELLCVYTGGMEGNLISEFKERIPIQLTAYDVPGVRQPYERGQILTNTTAVNNYGLWYKGKDRGFWESPGPETIGYYSLNSHSKYGLLAGGASKFVSMKNGATSTIAATNGIVHAQVTGNNGLAYWGGVFTTPWSYFARYDGNSTNAVNLSLNGGVYALALDTSGNIWVGGTFTTVNAGSVNRLFVMNPTTETVVTSYNVNGDVWGIYRAIDGSMYIVGAFTSVNGVTVNRIARLNPTTSTWEAVGPTNTFITGSGANIIYAITQNKAGQIIVGGNFNLVGTTSGYVAYYNGVVWQTVGQGFTAPVYGLLYDESTSLLYAAGDITTEKGISGGNTYGLELWDGINWLPSDLGIISGTAAGRKIIKHLGGLAAAFYTYTASAQVNVAAVTTINYLGNAGENPRILLRNRLGGADVQLVCIRNETTGASVYFKPGVMILKSNETILINFEPNDFNITSNLFGDLTSRLFDSTNLKFGLTPGINKISVSSKGTAGDMEAILLWYNRLQSLTSPGAEI